MSDTIDRRALLAAVPAVALAAVVPAATASSGMAGAIARHRAAWDYFEANVWRVDKVNPRYYTDTPENNDRIYDEASDAEREALAEVIAVVPANMDEVRMRFRHLLAVDAKAALDCDDLATLFETMA